MFPLQLNHPAFRPAVISDRSKGDQPGRPAQFPPVIVQNEDQLEEYRAKGYLPSAELAAVGAAELSPENEYPKYIKSHGVIAKNREHEFEILISPVPEEKFIPPQAPRLPGQSELEVELRDALVARVEASGIEFDTSLSVEELRKEMQRRVLGYA